MPTRLPPASFRHDGRFESRITARTSSHCDLKPAPVLPPEPTEMKVSKQISRHVFKLSYVAHRFGETAQSLQVSWIQLVQSRLRERSQGFACRLQCGQQRLPLARCNPQSQPNFVSAALTLFGRPSDHDSVSRQELSGNGNGSENS